MSAAAPSVPATGFAAGLRSLDSEVSVDALPLRGELPVWLRGSLLRTGPAKWEVGRTTLRHWFDGMAMLHRFAFGDGRVAYANRFLEGRTWRAARERGEIALSEFATDPCRSLYQRVQSIFSPEDSLSDNANVNIGRLGERFVAMTETPLPVEFDPRTLAAAGAPYTAPGHLTTAHPHRERSSNAMLNYAARLGPRSEYRFYRVAPETARPEVLASLPVSEPAYMHSFGLTERWFVLAEFPLVVNPARLALRGRPYIENYRWKPERGTRFTLVDRASGRVGGRWSAEPCFAFHHVNAYERDGEVVVDLVAFPDARIIDELYLDRLREAAPIEGATLRRFVLAPGRDDASQETLSDAPLELPRINYARCNERAHRHVWAAATGDSGWFDHLVKIDVEQRRTTTWAEPGTFPGEPVFVAAPDAEAEDDGVLLSVVLDAASERSFLLVLDAADLRELARAEAPHHIPFGFHGQYAAAGA